MANKTLGTRQKLTFRISSKPRNPVAVAAKQRAAGAHRKSVSALRQQQNILMKKKLTESEGE